MEWWEAGLLGLLQGLTEFLPVSSSAHLVLGQKVLGIEAQGDLLFEVFVHLGTALSIVTLYWRRVGAILAHTLRAVRQPVRAYHDFPDVRLSFFILLTMVPTGLTYLLLAPALEAAFGNVRLVCGLLFVTGLLLLLTALKRAQSGALNAGKALVIGLAQCTAFLPGISRSGVTICAALYQNVRPRDAADFSFLMAVPVIFGAALVKGLGLVAEPAQADLVPLVLGTVVAYISGVAAIKVVLRFVKRGSIHYFAYYCFGIGLLGLLLN